MRGNRAAAATPVHALTPGIKVVLVPLDAWNPTEVAITPAGRIITDELDMRRCRLCRRSDLAFCCFPRPQVLMMG
jgi:hypothetical protein